MKLSPEVIEKIESLVADVKRSPFGAERKYGITRWAIKSLVSTLRNLGADIPKAKRGGGRESKVDIELAKTMLARGCDRRAVAEYFGVRPATIGHHMNKTKVAVVNPSPADVAKEIAAQSGA